MIESSIACVLRRRKGREHPAGVSAPATARSRLAGGLSSAFVPLCYKMRGSLVPAKSELARVGSWEM